MKPTPKMIGVAVAISALLFAQILKCVIASLRAGSMKLQMLSSSGGMPSSHTAMVTSMASWIVYKDGLDSSSSSVAIVLVLVVMYDATHVRYESGKHASELNWITKQLHHFKNISDKMTGSISHYQTEEISKNDDLESQDGMSLAQKASAGWEQAPLFHTAKDRTDLQESLGHTPSEVLGGLATGLLWSGLCYLVTSLE